MFIFFFFSKFNFFCFCFIGVPSIPIGPLEIINITENTADLEWKPPKHDGGRPIVDYIIENRTMTRVTWSKCGTVDGKTTAFTATNLLEETEYLFRVIAVNEEGKSPPLEATDITKPTRKIRESISCTCVTPSGDINK